MDHLKCYYGTASVLSAVLSAFVVFFKENLSEFKIIYFSLIEKRMKLPKFKKAVIAEVKLEPKDGKIKKTFGFAHYSWWRTNHFNVSQAKVL